MNKRKREGTPSADEQLYSRRQMMKNCILRRQMKNCNLRTDLAQITDFRRRSREVKLYFLSDHRLSSVIADMDQGDADTSYQSIAETEPVVEQFSSLDDGGGIFEEGGRKKVDPRLIARKYQLDICDKAMEENTVVYLETGCGKTHIAVLLMHAMGSLIRSPKKDICVFLAPTVALVEQQFKVIQESTDFKVGLHCGKNKHFKKHQVWEKEVEKYEVLVMTPQILLHNLSHCFIRIEIIALLIFDECHYAQLESNHPYAEIMKVFYRSDAVKLPRVFGMTASPKLGKGTSINTLETLLHSKVISVDKREELNEFVVTPKLNICYYDGSANHLYSSYMIYRQKLGEIKCECVSSCLNEKADNITVKNTKKMLLKLQNNLVFCLETLGVRGAYQACSMLMEGDHSERNEWIEAKENDSNYSICNKYLAQSADMLGMDNAEGPNAVASSSVDVLEEPFFSRKLLRLVEILSEFRVQQNMNCIIFVKRTVVAKSLTCILRSLSILSFWRCDFLIGVRSGKGNKSRKNIYSILEKFRSGELNLLVATKVAEEGLDIQTCCLVVRFDLPETVSSFIQSRGRARMPQSEYALLVDRTSMKEMNLLESFMKEEDEMNKEIACRTSSSTFVDFDEKAYTVASSGATVSRASSVSLLYHYCAKLPRDEYFTPKPELLYFDETKMTVCTIILPSNAPIHKIVGSPQSSREEAKKDACLKACEELHELGALTDYLLPEEEDENDESFDFFSSENSNDPISRRELHEMLVPAILKEPWDFSENSISLNSYYMKLSPTPPDRVYRNFGLFLKAPLPEEAERMKLDLCLSHGRTVTSELLPLGLTEFDQDKMLQAQWFQKILLKAIHDRSELIADFFTLDEDELSNPETSTFYLLLPVIVTESENTMTVDWCLLRRSLSSPMFRTPDESRNKLISLNNNHLQLANGPYSTDDVVNSLIYVPCKKAFFFIADVVTDKNAYSLYKDRSTHIQHYMKKSRIEFLYPDQPLLKAKRVFVVVNLLRKGGYSVSRIKEEHFIELPPEICQLKIIGFSKDIGSSMYLLPSIMHRLENFLVAIELKQRLTSSFSEGAEVTAARVLEALTTEKCCEHFSLERLEVLGDAFLKFAVGRYLFLCHDSLDEGKLTRKRSNIVQNSNLLKLATMKKLQVYIRDQPFDPCQFFALGRPCSVKCDKDKEHTIHSPKPGIEDVNAEIRCNKGHHWLYKKTIADVVEALIGAFIVDSGFKAATAFLKWLGIELDFDPSQVSKICRASNVFTPLSAIKNITSLESSIGYHFLYQGLLVQAFIHPSYNNPLGGCYQRLEFLGDAVLDYLITSYLYSVYPKLKPGQLTDLRSSYVNNVTFARIAVNKSFQKFVLYDCLHLSSSMNKYVDFIRASSMEGFTEGPNCPKALGDVVESFIGAILLDTGFDLKRVWNTVLSFMDPVINFTKLQLNPLRELVELCQFYHWDLQLPAVKKDGRFVIEGKVKGSGVLETACSINLSKKAGLRTVSEQLFLKLKAKGYRCKSRSLEEILNSASKMEAKLIGYDEAAIDVTDSDATPINNLKIEESPPHSHLDMKEITESKGQSVDMSSKSLLYSICGANCWKPPYYECVSESGASHLKEFVFNVTVDIEEKSEKVVAFGEARSKKKDAAEHAAEGAVWCLRNLGY